MKQVTVSQLSGFIYREELLNLTVDGHWLLRGERARSVNALNGPRNEGYLVILLSIFK